MSTAENERRGEGEPEAGAELALRVFTGEERWGWEFVQPPAPPAHRDAHNPPVYTEPSGEEVRAMEERAMIGKKNKGSGCLVLLAGIVGFAVGGGTAAAIVVCLVIVVLMASSPSARLKAARNRLETSRAHARRDHERRRRAWQSRIDAHREEHLRHNETLDTWFPLSLASRPSRIDVFGGTGNGWASLLATVGGPLLGSGQPLVVLDLTQQAVALELAGLAASRDIAVTHVPMPGALLDMDLRDEFTPEELAETIAEALGTMRPPGADVDLHTIDVDVVQTVAELLEGPVTFTRLAAGLRVLLRVYDTAPDAPGTLSLSEVESITRAIDLLGQGERVQNELRYMRAQTELLTPRKDEVAAPGGRAAEWWQAAGLTIVTTEDSVRRRKDLTDRFVFFRLLHVLRKRAVPNGSGTLIVAGAGHLGRDALESMAREARTAGVRLVFLLEHLREDTVQVAGGSDSATVFMRMGNGEEAKAAAQFIGQEHKFLVNQLTRQTGETLTEGRGSSYGYQRGVSDTDGFNRGGGMSGSNWGSSRSFSTSLSRSWQDSTNTSTAQSTTTGENLSRVYEFAVEPTQLQALPVTGLVLVEAGPGGRRVVFGDCNPGINFLPRLSSRPRASLT
ncbi:MULTISPECIES: hypothetical protein [unclassified Streptomyces]|uniref:hypothetical protein n=1 Tax=unclassified Streptomyces TaxID=2593676 RepID=UPI00081B0D0A|nr:MULTISPECIES: hypothetical protein [unclassified Streptomyces]MYQ89612.1 hypothetical protein [Streptomyces sp. SID4936]SCE59033.1 hypothetical protein GA0115234_114716 [Streptomyces sp. DvalAA-43]